MARQKSEPIPIELSLLMGSLICNGGPTLRRGCVVVTVTGGLVSSKMCAVAIKSVLIELNFCCG